MCVEMRDPNRSTNPFFLIMAFRGEPAAFAVLTRALRFTLRGVA